MQAFPVQSVKFIRYSSQCVWVSALYTTTCEQFTDVFSILFHTNILVLLKLSYLGFNNTTYYSLVHIQYSINDHRQTLYLGYSSVMDVTLAVKA